MSKKYIVELVEDNSSSGISPERYYKIIGEINIPVEKPEENQSGIKLMHEATIVTRLEAAMDEVMRESPENVYHAKYFTRLVFKKLFPSKKDVVIPPRPEKPKMVTKEAEENMFTSEFSEWQGKTNYFPKGAINVKCTYEVPEK